MDTDIAQVAWRQNGNVTRNQLLGLSFDDNAIRLRIRTGRLHRVHRGVYAVGRPPKTPLERASAAVLACGPTAALSHASAMTLWGFWKRWDAPFEVTVSGDRRPKGIKTHRSATLRRNDVRTHLGIRVTSPARTLNDIAPRLSDKQLTRGVNDALLSAYVKRAELALYPRLARFATESGAPTRSELEDAFVAFCERFDLPRPKINASVCGYEVDALFEAEKLIVELDGYQFHSSKTSFERDRNRDADTLAAGHATVRLTWERLENEPAQEAERLLAILARRRPSPGPRPSDPGRAPPQLAPGLGGAILARRRPS